ncbi:MAG TPA: glycoside hydrolase family 31 protein [Oscillospiraceae bacterium]|nr:glycoside hydrolase family 31 protein [Oscillospiraceae bacterium]HPS34799.1 glycoside hydrolase family 31 protein [Oscillospiraceae bacterium]
MLQPGKIIASQIIKDDLIFTCENEVTLKLNFPEASILRVRMSKVPNPRPSIMAELGYVKESLEQTPFDFAETREEYRISTRNLVVSVGKKDARIQLFDKQNHCILKTADAPQIGKESLLTFDMKPEEHFYGFGFQRKTLDARGHKLTFTRNYRWNEATTPYFLSTAGYGFFSANTFDQTFDFTGEDFYSVFAKGGHVDFFIFYGPSFKDILNLYTALTGRPVMVPKWAMGMCYIARCFEDDKGLLNIAKRFRSEQIPCYMLGLEPGWEETWYSMDWIWNRERFPEPEKMIKQLGDMGFKFELWESGKAPTESYLDPNVRDKWFEQRVDASIKKGVAFYKQDDPYPRCITTTEMVLNPDVSVFVKDTDDYTEEETKNITNTLYTKTLFDGFRRVTGKRTIVMLHAYNSSTSSQMFPTAWAGDFKLGNGALNAGLSGHAMVSQDMDSESPEGLHFGFLTPFSIIDSWAYYREPWRYSEANMDVTRFYSKLKSSLFPYLYTALWQAHTQGTPMLRPMILEFQDDPNTALLDKQFMLGNFLLVGTGKTQVNMDFRENAEKAVAQNTAPIYLPKGRWIDYWTGKTVPSSGEWHTASWPGTVGGPLFVKAGAIIPMTNAGDSISQNKQELSVLDIYPHGKSSAQIYADDGETFEYENNRYALTEINCEELKDTVGVQIGESIGVYTGKREKAHLIKIHLVNIPEKIMLGKTTLSESSDLSGLLTSFKSGWHFDSDAQILWIKPTACWKLKGETADYLSFYNNEIEWAKNAETSSEIDLQIIKGQIGRRYGAVAQKIALSSQYPVLLADGESQTIIKAVLQDSNGLPVNKKIPVIFTVSGSGSFTNGQQMIEAVTQNGVAETVLISSKTEGNALVTAQSQGLPGEKLDVKVVQGTFDAVFNPPERIRLYAGDCWLRYYVYTYAQIKYNNEIIRSAKCAVTIQITGNEEREIERNHSSAAVCGTARFPAIVLGSPTEPPDVVFHFNAKGVTPADFRYHLD